MQRKEFFQIGLTLTVPLALTIGAALTGCGGGSSGVVNPNPTPTATPGPTPTPAPPPANLVFVSNAGFNVDLYFLAPGGAAPIRLTSDSANDVQPSLSPDRRLVAYSSTFNGNPEIYVINVATRVEDRLTEDTGATPPVDDSPVFSQAGDRIAWRSTRGGLSNIWVMQVTGATQARLSNEPAGAFDPFWHPDGTRVGYVTTRNGAPRIVIKNVVGGAEQVLDVGPGPISHPRFNRTGERIVFSRGGSTAATSQLFIVNTSGGAPTPGPTAGTRNFDPNWSNDGTRIIWAANGGVSATPQIFSANPDGTDVQRLTNNSDSNTYPSAGG